jgi:hypothetical protein
MKLQRVPYKTYYVCKLLLDGASNHLVSNTNCFSGTTARRILQVTKLVHRGKNYNI